MRRLWHRLLVRLGWRVEAPPRPLGPLMRAALRANTSRLIEEAEKSNAFMRAMRNPPRLVVSRDFLTPEIEEQLKNHRGHITVHRPTDIQWLPRQPETREPGPHIWRMLSFRSKLREWSDWMPMQDALLK